MSIQETPDQMGPTVQDWDDSVERDGAMVQVHNLYKPFGHILVGNQRGLIRLGIECLRTALGPDESADLLERIEELEYLKGSDFHAIIDIRRQDSLRYESYEPPPIDEDERREVRIYWIVQFVFFGIFCVCMSVGVVTVFRWLLSWFW